MPERCTSSVRHENILIPSFVKKGTFRFERVKIGALTQYRDTQTATSVVGVFYALKQALEILI